MFECFTFGKLDKFYSVKKLEILILICFFMIKINLLINGMNWINQMSYFG